MTMVMAKGVDPAIFTLLSEERLQELARLNRVYLVAGIPGSGKDSFCQAIVDRCPDAAALIGASASLKRHFPAELAQYKALGELVPDSLTINAVFSDLYEARHCSIIMVSGFPRNEVQATYAAAYLPQDVARLQFELDPEVAKRRMIDRLVCASCDGPTGPPHQIGDPCRRCGEGRLVRRPDDTPIVVNKRVDDEVRRLRDVYGCLSNYRAIPVQAHNPPAVIINFGLALFGLDMSA